MKLEGMTYTKEGHIATLTLNRPEVLNALTTSMLEDIERVQAELQNDRDTRVLIVTGSGRGFCSGTDVGGLAQSLDSGEVQAPRTTTSAVGRFIPGFRALPQPVIAAINGVVAGIGISLALACDIRIAANSARFRAAWINRGFIPDGGATHLMPRLIGLPNAAEMCLMGEIVDSAYAERVGLVSRVVPDQDLMPTVMEMAQKLAAGPPLAIARAKQALYKGLGNTLEEAIEHEGFVQAELRRTEDHAEGVRAFIEKREPVFKGR